MLAPMLIYVGGLLSLACPGLWLLLPFFGLAGTQTTFPRRGMPMLAGMTITATAMLYAGSRDGAWLPRIGLPLRAFALIALAGTALRRLAARETSPLAAHRTGGPGRRALALGAAMGLAWLPDASPMADLIRTSAAHEESAPVAIMILLTYVLGAASVLVLAGELLVGIATAIRPSARLRRLGGALALAAAMLLVLRPAQGTASGESALERRLVDVLQAQSAQAAELPSRAAMPSLDGATAWLNSPPLDRAMLRGKVVLVDFWTYSCINCLRALPYVRAWYDKYKDHGLVVIGVHAPEFDFEKDPAHVRRTVRELGITYPVAIDDDYAIWNGFGNQYWPAHYFIDAQGIVRGRHHGEGDYARSEDTLRALLTEAGRRDLPAGYVQPRAQGAQAPDSQTPARSPETYLGHARAERFAGGRLLRDEAGDYHPPARLAVDEWALAGRWRVGAQSVTALAANDRILYRFRGRDLHLVLAPMADGRAVRFRITLDGKPPGADHGVDVDADGNGTVTTQRLYQLVRQHEGNGEREFAIEFLDPGVRAYAFTFG
ncbi:MAG: redoxin domain-containing protein [Fulvimonas sp.]|nr:redoxin domain-containing protein [Fulvimonas sp.]